MKTYSWKFPTISLGYQLLSSLVQIWRGKSDIPWKGFLLIMKKMNELTYMHNSFHICPNLQQVTLLAVFIYTSLGRIVKERDVILCCRVLSKYVAYNNFNQIFMRFSPFYDVFG